MDYIGFVGAPAIEEDQAARQYFRRIDEEFYDAAWFAQAPGAPLYSNLIDYRLLAGKSVLEVGCGLGAISAELARQSAKVTSVDITSTGVRAVTQRFRLDRTSGRAVQADAERLPFADASFDFVWSWGVLHHTPDTAAAMREVVRVVKPGGEIGVMLYNRHSYYNWFNVIFRYGVLRLELLKYSVRELWNRHTDGKSIGGCPHAVYFTAAEMREMLSGSNVFHLCAYERKLAVSGFAPRFARVWIEQAIPDRIFHALFRRFGFLLFCKARKAGR